MYLKDLIPNINKKYKKFFFSDITFDSNKVKKNSIFFAIKGNKFDGNDFINQAIENGAKIIISEKKILKKREGILFYHIKKLCQAFFIIFQQYADSFYESYLRTNRL